MPLRAAQPSETNHVVLSYRLHGIILLTWKGYSSIRSGWSMCCDTETGQSVVIPFPWMRPWTIPSPVSYRKRLHRFHCGDPDEGRAYTGYSIIHSWQQPADQSLSSHSVLQMSWNWINGSVVESSYCSCRGPKFGSRHPRLVAYNHL